MITAIDDGLSRPEKERIKDWLSQPEADLFLQALADVSAGAEVEALSIMDRHRSLLNATEIPVAAMTKLREAAVLKEVIRNLETNRGKDSLLPKIRLIATPNA